MCLSIKFALRALWKGKHDKNHRREEILSSQRYSPLETSSVSKLKMSYTHKQRTPSEEIKREFTLLSSLSKNNLPKNHLNLERHVCRQSNTLSLHQTQLLCKQLTTSVSNMKRCAAKKYKASARLAFISLSDQKIALLCLALSLVLSVLLSGAFLVFAAPLFMTSLVAFLSVGSLVFFVLEALLFSGLYLLILSLFKSFYSQKLAQEEEQYAKHKEEVRQQMRILCQKDSMGGFVLKNLENLALSEASGWRKAQTKERSRLPCEKSAFHSQKSWFAKKSAEFILDLLFPTPCMPTESDKSILRSLFRNLKSETFLEKTSKIKQSSFFSCCKQSFCFEEDEFSFRTLCLSLKREILLILIKSNTQELKALAKELFNEPDRIESLAILAGAGDFSEPEEKLGENKKLLNQELGIKGVVEQIILEFAL